MAHFSSGLQSVFARIETLPKPSVAAIDGAAMGGGLELALACDFRIIGRKVRLGLPEVGIGLLPGAGGTQRLTCLVGPGVARRLILGAEEIDGREAERIGVVQWRPKVTWRWRRVVSQPGWPVCRRTRMPPRNDASMQRRDQTAVRGKVSEIRLLIESPQTGELLARSLA